MSIQVDLATYLLTKASVTALVGQRIFVGKLPESITTRPAVTCQRISNVHRRHFGGEEGNAVARVQVDVWAATSASSDAVAEAIRLVLDGDNQLTMNGTEVRNVFLDGDSDTYNTSIDGSDQGEHRVSQDWIIWYGESTPSFS